MRTRATFALAFGRDGGSSVREDGFDAAGLRERTAGALSKERFLKGFAMQERGTVIEEAVRRNRTHVALVGLTTVKKTMKTLYTTESLILAQDER